MGHRLASDEGTKPGTYEISNSMQQEILGRGNTKAVSALRTKGTQEKGLKGEIKTKQQQQKQNHMKILAKTEFLTILILFPRLNNNSYLFLEMILSFFRIVE